MKTGFAIIISFLFLFVFGSPASSQVYQWKDKEGNIHFSDTPPPAGAEKAIKIRQVLESPGGITEGAGPSSRSLGEKRPYGRIYIVLYMADWCGYSKKAEEYLNSLGVNFVEYDVEKDIDKWREMMEKSGGRSGVPVIDVEGIIIKGYNPDSIKAAVEKRRSAK
jgi:glutaredoxin